MNTYPPERASYGAAALLKLLSQTQSLSAVFVLLFAVDFPYQYGFRYLSVVDSVVVSFIHALLFTAVLWMTTRLDLARVTLCFLALPYLIFIPGWLNITTATGVLLIFLYCIIQTLRHTRSITSAAITTQDVFAFVFIIAWVTLSGAGGEGAQTADYTIHNARLHDLITYVWPVHYGDNQNFVSYVGYFLPAAIIGKVTSAEFAARCMHPWTVLGMTLAIRWLSVLSRWRFSAALVIIFIIFGPLDILNVLVLDFYTQVPFEHGVAKMLENADYLDFRTRYDIGFFIGNYLSNTFQLFWSPHQVIAGWLCISLMTYLFLQQQLRHFIFVYALLCLWSPLIMLALSPFVLLTVATSFANKRFNAAVSEIFTITNTLGAGVITAIFVIFYLGGSPQDIPSRFIFESFDWKNNGGTLCLFYLSTWGLYVLLLAPFAAQLHTQHKQWFVFLLCSLLLLSIKSFGAFNDLLCRGSAPLMFLLLVFLLQAIKYYQQQKRIGVAMLLCVLLAGSGSSFLQLRNAVYNYNHKPVVIGSITTSSYAEENLGPDNSFFNRYFRRHATGMDTRK